MTWTAPRTWAPNDLITATLMNEQLRDNLNVLISLVPTGLIVPYAGINLPTSPAPAEWLLCDGSAVSRTTYAALFSTVGTSFGAGDGSTTFNVPDLRGRFPLGKDNMGGTSANRVTATQADNLGQSSGQENHTLSVAEMPNHTHRMDYQSGGTYAGYYQFNKNTITAGSDLTAATNSSRDAGGGGAHNNMPPYQTLNYIIKA